jgi:hypothetical protein
LDFNSICITIRGVNEFYETPTPDELQKFLSNKKLTGADLSALTGVIPRTARYWVSSAKRKYPHIIPWAAWALLQILIGEKSKEEILRLIDQWKKDETGHGLYERGIGGCPPNITSP